MFESTSYDITASPRVTCPNVLVCRYDLRMEPGTQIPPPQKKRKFQRPSNEELPLLEVMKPLHGSQVGEDWESSYLDTCVSTDLSYCPDAYLICCDGGKCIT